MNTTRPTIHLDRPTREREWVYLTPAADMEARYRPSEDQIAVARAMFATAPNARRWHVVVPLALPGKAPGVWIIGQEVRPIPGAWLARSYVGRDSAYAHSKARDAADAAAAEWLTAWNLTGGTAYAVIREDGTWAVFDGLGRDAD